MKKKYKNYRRVFKKTALEAENVYFKNKFDQQKEIYEKHNKCFECKWL